MSKSVETIINNNGSIGVIATGDKNVVEYRPNEQMFINIINESSLSENEKICLLELSKKDPTFKDRLWGVLNSFMNGLGSGITQSI